VGLAASVRRRRVPGAVVASTTVLAYRMLSAALFRDAQVSLLAERVGAEDARTGEPERGLTVRNAAHDGGR
jgi:hypothetical protein